MKSAAAIADTFKLDPIVVLKAEPAEWLMRLAAHNAVVTEHNKREAERSKKAGR